MYKVVGKAYYQVEYDGQVYPKVRYTLELEQEDLDRKKLTGVTGTITDTVCLSHRTDTDKPQLGDKVVVSYGFYNGQKKPNGIFVID